MNSFLGFLPPISHNNSKSKRGDESLIGVNL
nr:MAG TPA: hypothetical protein [Caudoviricetes sp.]